MLIENAPSVTPTERQERGRLIDADALLKPIEESWKHAGLHAEDYKKIKKWIKNAPTIVPPVTPTERTGEWIEHDPNGCHYQSHTREVIRNDG